MVSLENIFFFFFKIYVHDKILILIKGSTMNVASNLILDKNKVFLNIRVFIIIWKKFLYNTILK